MCKDSWVFSLQSPFLRVSSFRNQTLTLSSEILLFVSKILSLNAARDTFTLLWCLSDPAGYKRGFFCPLGWPCLGLNPPSLTHSGILWDSWPLFPALSLIWCPTMGKLHLLQRNCSARRKISCLVLLRLRLSFNLRRCWAPSGLALSGRWFYMSWSWRQIPSALPAGDCSSQWEDQQSRFSGCQDLVWQLWDSRWDVLQIGKSSQSSSAPQAGAPLGALPSSGLEFIPQLSKLVCL